MARVHRLLVMHRVFRRFPTVTALTFVLLTSGCGNTVQLQKTTPPKQNPIQIENAKPGTNDWKLTNPATNHEIEGFASLTSVNRGEEISFFVNTPDPTFNLEIFRLGWYNGLGGRRLTQAVTLAGTVQPIPSPDPVTGLAECQWANPYVLTIPKNSDPTDWASGVYLAKLTATTSGKQSYIIFVVRDDARRSDFLFQSSFNTFQAYNNWGGKSLYDWNSPGGAAVKVSYNRPFAFGDQPTSASGVGAGEFLTNIQPADQTYASGWEYPFLRFVEREGFDLTYSSDVDTHARGDLILNHKVFLSVGHNEYWTWEQRANVTAARDARVSLGFFSANTLYWQVRYEPGADGTPNRTIVCYKTRALTEDPYYLSGDPAKLQHVTVRWRDAPVNLPEDALVGVMYYTNPVHGDFVADNTSNFVYANTGLSSGSSIPGLLGYEVDQMFGHAPAGTVRVAHSVYGTGAQDFSDSTYYTALSGSTVFAIGSMQWNYGLDDYGVPDVRPSFMSAAAQQITRNVLNHLAGNP